MPSRTQIVCLHEGEKGHSIDPIFIRKLLKSLDPSWIRPWKGNNIIRTRDCGGRNSLINIMPQELLSCVKKGGDTTLMVWADVDDDVPNCDALKDEFWKISQMQGVTLEQFNRVVFIFARDRIENWIEFLNTGTTDESKEGPRVKYDREVADAAKKLAEMCLSGIHIPSIPSSLEWSCRNWRALKNKMEGV